MDKLSSGAAELGISLSETQLTQFQTYYEELVAWNRRVNLTAVIGYEDVQLKHFLDSLSVSTVIAPWLRREDGCRMLDVGSGAGLPGLPLKIAFPTTRLVLLDSILKKTTFLLRLTRALGLEDVEVVTARAEDLAHQEGYREEFDVVVSRAVAALPTLLELTLPFCRTGGVSVAQKRGDIGVEVNSAGKAIGILGGRLREIRPVGLPGLPGLRSLVVVEKIMPCPPQYPRRIGVPAKRPIL